MKTILAAALALVTTTATATTLPPAQFDRPAANVEIREVPYNKVHNECGGGSAQFYRTEACAYPHMDPPLIILPTRSSVSARKWDCLLRHELGHINGWMGHIGGRETVECGN